MSNALGDVTDPLAAFRFGVEIEGVVKAYFTECTGLTAQMEVFEYKEGGQNAYSHKLPGRTSYGNVTLKWGMTDDMDLWLWYEKMRNWVTNKAGSNQRKNVSIIQFDTDEKVQHRRWDLIEAYPVKWVGPTFNSAQSQASVESIELAFRYLEAKGK
ncbi:MAG: phage tail protein [Dehalococcoidia bacterium]